MAPKDAVAVVRAEGRLQKLDFWLRNPDYLADELLNDYERSRDRESINLELAGKILDSDEPEICAIPMLRHLFGAFEYIDQAMSVLAVPRLVVVVPRRNAERVLQDNFYITSKGREVAARATEQFSVLAWYTERAFLVRALAEATGHSALALRKRQYLQRDYAQTPLNEIIPSIADRARARLARLRAEAEQQGNAA